MKTMAYDGTFDAKAIETERLVGQLKQFLLLNFEKTLAAALLAATFLGAYFIENAAIVLNFYYLPVLVAAYFLGRRTGVLVAVFSILLVVVCALVFPTRFLAYRSSLDHVSILSSWGGFLILTSITVGTLYEANERRLHDLKNAYVGIVEILSKYLESTDPYTKGHSERVAALAMEISIAMELPRADVETIRVAGLLHDIGKIEVSGEILRKAAVLTSSEKEIMDEHTERGARLLSTVGSVLKEVVPIVLAHHRYFTTLEAGGEATSGIPLGARIVAVADAFDAMTTDRPYRRGMLPWEAVEELVAKAGKQFDPLVVEAFKRVVGRKMETI
jgi:putative nucleotidyltransferase with HDIG domain